MVMIGGIVVGILLCALMYAQWYFWGTQVGWFLFGVICGGPFFMLIGTILCIYGYSKGKGGGW
jgi:hypothetical protein